MILNPWLSYQYPLWVIELLVSSGSAHPGVLDTPAVVTPQHLSQVIRLAPGNKEIR